MEDESNHFVQNESSAQKFYVIVLYSWKKMKEIYLIEH